MSLCVSFFGARFMILYCEKIGDVGSAWRRFIVKANGRYFKKRWAAQFKIGRQLIEIIGLAMRPLNTGFWESIKGSLVQWDSSRMFLSRSGGMRESPVPMKVVGLACSIAEKNARRLWLLLGAIFIQEWVKRSVDPPIGACESALALA